MACFCAARLDNLLTSLPRLPPLAGLMPPIPQDLLDALMPPPLPLASLSMQMQPPTAAAVAHASLTANLATLAGLQSNVSAALNMNLMPCLAGGPALASLRASLSETIASMNAHGPMLRPFQDLIAALLRQLAELLKLARLLTVAQARFGIDLRAGGAIARLQASLDALPSASLNARAALAPPPVPPLPSLMASLGFAATPAGASSLTASMQAMARLAASLPRLTVPPILMALLSALMAMLAALLSALKVDLLAPNALPQLRATLRALPLTALMTMRLPPAPRLTASASASLRPPALPRLPSLNLRAVAQMNMLPIHPVALAMQMAADAKLVLAPAGACGPVCPMAALKFA